MGILEENFEVCSSGFCYPWIESELVVAQCSSGQEQRQQWNESNANSNFPPPNEGCAFPKASCICLVDNTMQLPNQEEEIINLEKSKKTPYKPPTVSPSLLGWVRYSRRCAMMYDDIGEKGWKYELMDGFGCGLREGPYPMQPCVGFASMHLMRDNWRRICIAHTGKLWELVGACWLH